MQTTVLTTTTVPKYAPDFSAEIPLISDLADPQISVLGQTLVPVGSPVALATPSRTRISTTQPISSFSVPEGPEASPSPAANDDKKSKKPTRKRRSRRKPKRDDLRRRRRSLVISLKDYRAGTSAWHTARRRRLELDTLVTLRPSDFDYLDEQQRHAWCAKRLKSLGQWFADNDNRPEFTALWSREAKRVTVGDDVTAEGEHIHLLVHAGEHRDDLERMLRKSLKGQHEVDVRPATQDVLLLDCGWHGNAATYVLKAVSQQVWVNNRRTPHRPSGPVWGARCGWTTNIAA